VAPAEGALELAERLLGGDRAALSRMISWAENGDERYPAALARIYPRVGRGWRIGVTGPPGVGKSTLVNRLVSALRERGDTVGILAIDPSSPLSGGALLGDRIRMEERTADTGVYIRSMASRDSHGGLARACADATDVMDAFGFDSIVIETVGVGQAEYEIVSAADSVAVVLCPGAGDGIQAMKSGLLEVADVLVVNKADLDGADQLALDLEDAIRLRRIRRDEDWTEPVVRCSARDETGIADLVEALARHRSYLEGQDLEAIRRRRRVQQVRHVVDERLDEELWRNRVWGERVESRLRKSHTPYDVADEILRDILGPLGSADGAGTDTGGRESEVSRS